jgi:hypothetical protein
MNVLNQILCKSSMSFKHGSFDVISAPPIFLTDKSISLNTSTQQCTCFVLIKRQTIEERQSASFHNFSDRNEYSYGLRLAFVVRLLVDHAMKNTPPSSSRELLPSLLPPPQFLPSPFNNPSVVRREPAPPHTPASTQQTTQVLYGADLFVVVLFLSLTKRLVILN